MLLAELELAQFLADSSPITPAAIPAWAAEDELPSTVKPVAELI
jgi:hypothetical protein